MKVTIKSAEWKTEFSQVDMLKELAIKAVKHQMDSPSGRVGIVIECEIKRGKKSSKLYFNTYYILKAAGADNTAEILREKFKKQYNIDLAGEPI